MLRRRAKKAVFDAIELDVGRGRDATRSSLRSRFGPAIHQFAPPFRKRSVMHEDLEIRPSVESPGSAINQATRAHFAAAIQRLKDEDDIGSSSTSTATQLASRPRSGGRTAPKNRAR